MQRKHGNSLTILYGKMKNKRYCLYSQKATKGHTNDHKDLAENFCNFFTNVGKKPFKTN